MSKKIVFIGPPGAGKTTLRKVFFEGESASKFLEYALEPTHGQESIVLKLREDVGVFDLAGQENQFWLDTNKSSVFSDARIIIIVINIITPIKEILEFVKKVLNIRNEVTPTAITYLLLHKIDLIDENKLIDLKTQISKALFKESLLKITFTSIQKGYFAKTFSVFIDILKTCISTKIAAEKIDLNFYKDIINSLYSIQKNSLISKEELQYNLKLSNQVIDQMIDLLENKKYIKFSRMTGQNIIKLSEKGELYLNQILNNFSLEEINFFEQEFIDSGVEGQEKPHSFLGFIISDKEGLPILSVEIYEGFFKSFLKTKDRKGSLDHELIPAFISAMEKFSDEINIKNLPGFTFKGTNVTIQTFSFERFTITLFMNYDTNIKSLKNYIQEWFKAFLEKNSLGFDFFFKTGNIHEVSKLKDEATEWLDELNKKYRVLAFNAEIFDFKQAKDLYQKLEEMSSDKNLNEPKILKKIQKLKTDLIKASLEEDYQAIKEIAKKAHTLNS